MKLGLFFLFYVSGMVAGVAVEPSSLPGKVLSPILSEMVAGEAMEPSSLPGKVLSPILSEMVAGEAMEPSSLPGKVLSPILSGIDIQNLGNIVKNSSSTKSFVEALSNADPEKVREIIALLEQLAATSLSEKGDLETAVSDAAAALAAAESSLNDANQAVVDADSAVNNAINVVTESNTELSNAQADLAKAQADQVEAEDTKADKETAAATALSDRDTAQTAKDAADKMLEDHGPGYDDEHAIILQVIEMLRNLIEDKDCENAHVKTLIDSKTNTVSGWNIDVDYGPWNEAGNANGCTAGWFGWDGNEKIGSISTILNGRGHAILEFGECHNRNGIVNVYLDGIEIASASKGTTKKIGFDFNDGSKLEIKEFNVGIMELINFEVSNCNAV